MMRKTSDSGRPRWLRRDVLRAAGATVAAAALPRPAFANDDQLLHGIAMHGQPALPPGFAHLPYVNPAAPKGGVLQLGQIGTFDSLNPLNVIGVAANGIREYVYESLLARSHDEPFSLYGLIAGKIELPDDRRQVTFHLDPAARFSDGKAITAEDVVFSWGLLKEKGQPFHRAHYGNVERVETPSPGIVRFHFKDNGNREAPLLVGLMPVLPKHKMSPESFEKTTFTPPVGSGPYTVASLDPGRSVTYKRDPNWWGADKAPNRGRYNFDEIRFEYFRDQTTLFEAFKAGDVHVRVEDDAGRWAEGYAIPAVADGRMQRAEVPTGLPAGMTALVMNTRRSLFADQRVRRALILMFDFEWTNRQLFHGNYTRTQSFFARSELASHGIAASEREKELLKPFASQIKPEIMAGTYAFPKSDGQGHNRANMEAAFRLLNEAGYRQEGGRLVHQTSRQPLSFEMMAATRAEERLFQTFAKPLERLGVEARIRLADSSQRWARLKTFDFDMIQWTWSASLSPGNEQMNRWSQASADVELSLNYAGVKNPASDALIEAILAAREREAFVDAVRAFDRVLLSGDYVVPLYHARSQWVAYWSHLQRPEKAPVSGLALDTWWAK